MFTKFMEYRQEHDADNINANWDLQKTEDILSEYAHGFFGVDKIGRPIYIDKAGCTEVKKLLAKATLDDCIKKSVHMYENMMKTKFYACSHLFDRQIG